MLILGVVIYSGPSEGVANREIVQTNANASHVKLRRSGSNWNRSNHSSRWLGQGERLFLIKGVIPDLWEPEGNLHMAPIQKFYAANSRLDLTGKTALIVGGTQGIGKAIALRLSAQGASVAIAGRNEKLGAEVVNELKVRSPGFAEDKAAFSFHKFDASLISEVKRFVAEVKPQYEKTGLNYLFLTVGHPPGDTRTETAEGLEYQFAVQDLARFVIIESLVPELKKAHGGARVIDIMAPGGAKNVEFLEDLEFKKRPYSFFAVIERDSGYHDLMIKVRI